MWLPSLDLDKARLFSLVATAAPPRRWPNSVHAMSAQVASLLGLSSLRLLNVLEKDIQNSIQGGLVSKSASTIIKVAGAASLLFAGYVFLTALPDLPRCIRISAM